MGHKIPFSINYLSDLTENPAKLFHDICLILATLQRSGDNFAGTIAVTCEGSGYVRLQYVNGTTIDCPVGYVTSLEDRWDFVVRDRSCTDTLRTAG
jgi:hypothetical protein